MKRVNKKLCPRLFVPFKVQQLMGIGAYKLELPKRSAIHLVFHGSRLNKALGPAEQAQTTLPELSSTMEWRMELQDVLAAE